MSGQSTPGVPPLIELRWATQFTSERARTKFLRECNEKAGGSTFFRTHALDYLYIGCATPGVAEEVRGLVMSFSPHTINGFLPVLAPPRGVGFVLPKESNEIGKSRKRVTLYDKRTRERLLAYVCGRFGQHQVWECDGYWIQDGRTIRDHSDYVFFPDTTLMWDSRMGGPPNTVVLPRRWFRDMVERPFMKGEPMGAEVRLIDDRRAFPAFLCDQDSYYISGGGSSEVVRATRLDEWLRASPRRRVDPA